MLYRCANTETNLVRGTAKVGDAEIIVCTDGTCRFDGGAMFGVVPRTLWQKKMVPDDQNRVKIGLNCVIVRIGGRTVLIETGFGNKLTPKLKAICDIQERLPASLNAAQVPPESVDTVINTHLHWDHCGWNTTLGAEGIPRPFFPNAVYVAHLGEVEHGRRQWERDRISYVPANYEPLLAENRMRLVAMENAGDTEEICPGVRVECFPGHTRQMMVVHVESAGEHACFVSDLIPTTAHLDLTWVMGFDLDPMRTIEERRRFLDRAILGKWLVLFPHDHAVPMGTLARHEKGSAYIADRDLQEG